MQVILLDKVANLGSLGDQVNVKAGYARNFLVPQGKAVPATKKNVEFFEARRAELEAKLADVLAAANARAEAINALRQALKGRRAKVVRRTAFCVPLVSTKLTSRFTAKCSLNWLLT